VFWSFPVLADVIRLKGGQEENVQIRERKKDRVIFEDSRGKVGYYLLDDVEKIGDEVINPPEAVKTPAAVATVSAQFVYQGKGDASDLFDAASRAVVYIQNRTASGDESIGSGFVISSDGVIVTNHHVAAKANELSARFKDGQVFPVERVLWKDAIKDIFVFKIKGQGFPALALADWKGVRIGERVFVIGNPLGMEYSFSDGMVAAIRALEGTRYIQFTAPISPGNSGGPVLNAKGEVLGIATMYLQGGQNLNFAVSVAELPDGVTQMQGMAFSEFAATISKAADLIREAAEYWFISRDLEKALVSLQKAVDVDPSSVEAHNYLGRVLQEMKSLDQGDAEFKKAIELDPTYPSAYINLGVNYREKGRLDEAERLYQKALELDPKSVTAYINLGLLYKGQGQLDEAERLYLKAIEIDSQNAVAYNNIGNLYSAQRRLDEAERLFKKAIELDPKSPSAYSNLGILYYEKGQFDQAEEYAKKTLELDPKFAAEQGIDDAMLQDLKNKAAAKKNPLWPFGK
jgi:S1-C subfamily serine protease/predicted TPR repeat methyltransferase